jgi:hypothetical protein
MSTGRGTAQGRAASLVEAAIAGVAAPRGDPAAVQAHLDVLTKPPGSLGRLESTAQPVDDEVRERIEAHRRSRPAVWRTIEVPEQAGGAILAAAADQVVLMVAGLEMSLK